MGADLVPGAAVVAMGLLAGLIYAFPVSIMPDLAAAEDRTLVDAMQQMADNPAYPLTFLAAPALAVVALVRARGSGAARSRRWIGAGLAFYTLAALVTFAVHVPLNDELVQAGDPASIENLAAVRDDFVTPGRHQHRPHAGGDGGLRLPRPGARPARTRRAHSGPRKGDPMRFVLTYVYDPEKAALGGMEEIQEWIDLEKEIRDAGAHVHAEGLQPASEARTLTVRDGDETVVEWEG